jgi:hypothetical protein
MGASGVGGGGSRQACLPHLDFLNKSIINIEVRKYKYQILKVFLKLSFYPEYSTEISKIALQGFDVNLYANFYGCLPLEKMLLVPMIVRDFPEHRNISLCVP